MNRTTYFKHACGLALAALLLSFAPSSQAQAASLSEPDSKSAKPFYLHDGDTVVFYGDSITEQRFYTYWVEVYAETRFPHRHFTFYNAGVGGDRVTGGSAGPIDVRLPRDVFAQKPSVVTIMLGMNDGGYKPLDAATETRYTQGYEHILDSIQQALPAARITLLGPSPYDEVTRPVMFPGGYNGLLQHFSAIDAQLAARRKATFIDLNEPFVEALKRGEAIDPLATELLLPDRVHPEQLAHWFMAAAILKGWNAPAIVSSATIDAAGSRVIDQQNTHVTELTGDDSALSWTELDEALPLPLDDHHVGIHFLRQLIPLEQELDRQPLVVQGLKPGNYELRIDGQKIAQFTAEELAKGINLANCNTPMRGQAYRVSWLTRDRDDTHYVRLRMLVNQMDSGVSREKGAADLTEFEEVQQKLIYDMAQPKPHKFEIRAVVSQP